MKQYKMKTASKAGILFENRDGTVFIRFQECAQNSPFGQKCIGERDITKRMFVFFTHPAKTTIVVGCLPNWKIFAACNCRIFDDVRNAIENSGYSTYDLS